MTTDTRPDVQDRRRRSISALDAVNEAARNGTWREVTLALRTGADDDAAVNTLRRELAPLSAATRVEGSELMVRMVVPAGDGRTAAELALDLVEAAACRSGARLVTSPRYAAESGELEAVAVSA